MSGSVDLEITRWFAEHRSLPVTRFFRLLEDLGTSWAFYGAVFVAGVGAVAVLRRWSSLPRVLIALIITFAVTSPLKDVFDRPRPPPDLAITTLYESSMPSSHAVLTSAVVVAVLMASWWTSPALHRVAAVVGIAGCLLVGVAMIYLGGHWFSDIIVGWLLGAGITAAAMLLLKRLRLA